MTSRLGDAGASNDDASYTGAVSDSPVSLDYYRTKISEFQATLNALDSAYISALVAAELPLDETTLNDLAMLVSEYDSKKWTLKATAEALNGGAALVNSMGGRLPELSIPTTLGVPFALPVAVVAAIATAATLIVWGREWIAGVNARLENAQLLDPNASPEDKARLAEVIGRTRQAEAAANSTGFAALAPMLKWGAYAVLAFLAWRAVAPMLKGGSSRDTADD